MSNQHGISSFYNCEICERIFSNQGLLNQHLVDVHSIDNTATCAVCNEVYMNKTELDSHAATKHTRPNPDPKLYSIYCYTCDEHFNSQSIIKGSFPIEKATKLGNSSQVVMTPPPPP